MPMPYRFIALDLETTWLSPETDTIIEIAAIRFELEKIDGKYEMRNIEERTMLIDPERPLSEEVTMITGISQKMVEWREKWWDVRERVRAFIWEDTVIVWHNVLFDIAMLATHGIDISWHTVLDTFELSEIFSQDAESLNLLFLAKKYDLPIVWEHRALDDTKLSVWLFIHYIERFESLENADILIFSYFRERDIFDIVSTLLELTGKNISWEYTFDYSSEFISWDTIHTSHTRGISEKILSLDPKENTIEDAMEEKIHRGQKILLITNGKKQSQYWYEQLSGKWYPSELLIDTKRYCSIAGLRDMIIKPSLERKEIIFLIKILFWLRSTKTWLLDELKYYGDEHAFIDLLRSSEDEYAHFRKEQEKKIQESSIIIADMWMSELRTTPIFDSSSTTIITDIGEIEDIFRKSESKKVSFSGLFRDLEYLGEKNIITSWFREVCIQWISYIQNLVERIPERPTGDNPLPPGDYGETYYFDQLSLWHHGEKWLSMYTHAISDALKHHSIPDGTNYTDKRTYTTLISQIHVLIDISTQKDTNLGIILSIQKNDTTLNIIPRDVRSIIQDFLSLQSGEELILTGYHIDGPVMRRFLSEQCGLIVTEKNVSKEMSPKILQVQTDIKSLLEKSSTCLILSWSNKHLRTLSQDIQRRFPERKIFTQWISGGKWKMMTLFQKETGEKILLWLIDSWIDEYSIFEHIDTLIIAKVPFDPPTDPYYLARTVGMKNNFEEYGCPLAINKMNTLIWRASRMWSDTQIYCLDDRLSETLWGKKILDEIL